jgi:SET domain-containing protein
MPEPNQPQTRHPRLFIARSNIHGLGLFAGEDIEWGCRLIEYQGQLLSKKEVNRRQKFYDSIGFTCLIQFGDGQGIDGITGGNESRFINHSPQPNVGAFREDKWRIVFYSLEDIAKGEELTFNYGFDPKEISKESVNFLPERDKKNLSDLVQASTRRIASPPVKIRSRVKSINKK